MTYEKSVNFSGDSHRAMQVAIDFLMGNGFKITSKTDTTLSFTGPGMRRAKYDPWAGISEAQITVAANTISIRAEFGMFNLARVFLPVLAAILVGAEAAFFGFDSQKHGHNSMIPQLMMPQLLMVIVFVITMLIARMTQGRRTTRAIDTLLQNMATLAGSAAAS